MGPRSIILGLAFLGALRAPLAHCAGAEGGQPGAFLRAGSGARAAALGNAYVAAAEGAEGVYWDPAALAPLRGLAAASMVASLSHGRQFSTLNLAYGAGDAAKASAWGSWGLGWIGFSLGDDFEGRSGDTNSYYTFSDRQDALLLSHGRALTSWLDGGLTLKGFTRQLAGYNASGGGTDAGLTLKPARGLRLGLVGTDLYSRQTWSTGSEERFPATLRLGLLWELWARRLRVLGGAQQVEGRQAQFSAGLEGWIAELLALRAGINEQGLSAGLGVRLNWGKAVLEFGYAFLSDPLKEGNSQRFSLDGTY